MRHKKTKTKRVRQLPFFFLKDEALSPHGDPHFCPKQQQQKINTESQQALGFESIDDSLGGFRVWESIGALRLDVPLVEHLSGSHVDNLELPGDFRRAGAAHLDAGDGGLERFLELQEAGLETSRTTVRNMNDHHLLLLTFSKQKK